VDKAKPFCIAKREVWEAYKRVKANRGAAGVDDQSIEEFDGDLENNLYRLWNRMSSGSYMPMPVRRVDISKGEGKTRPLGIPAVSDRIAQAVAKRYLEAILEPLFHGDSYGYRPGRSAHQALDVARRRCWRYDWVLDLDIKGFFDQPSQCPPLEPTFLSKVSSLSLPALSLRSAASVAGLSGKRYNFVRASRESAMVLLWIRS
jgi:RNA-directed DNA polymerase